jgi:GNAT superfamily N-acetyltransferase
MPDITTRVAGAADGIRIAKLLEQLRREFGYSSQATVPLPVDQKGPNYVFLATGGDDTVGLACAERCHHLVRGVTFLLITDIYVIQAYRKRGISTLLFNEATALGKRIGCNETTLIISRNNEVALGAARRAGFVDHRDTLLAHALESEKR